MTSGRGHAWSASYAKATALVQNMTLAERVSLTAGVNGGNACSGFVPAVKRLGFPGMCLSDAGNGLRNTDFVSSWPSGIHVGASWNRRLALRRARAMGGEFKKKGVNVLLGPVVGPAGRTVRSGRIWEGFSIDPYLSGALVYQTVSGVQGAGVITSTKHFIANEQETHRQPYGDVQSVSANIDDRTMHELYLWPFQDAVYAGSGNIMCSYNRLNNSYACANSKILNGLLKTELGFQGFVVSDWDAQHSGVASALSGLDMAMPGGGSFWGDNLVEAVSNGSVPESRVTDMATRIIAAWYRMGQDVSFPRPGIGMPADLTKPHAIVDGRNASDKQTLLDGAIEGHVLLKNALITRLVPNSNSTNSTNGISSNGTSGAVNGTANATTTTITTAALPFRTPPRLMSIFGFSAKAADQNNYMPGNAAWTLGTESANGADTALGFGGGEPAGPLGIAPNGTLFSGGGSGATSQSLVSAPFDALVQQAEADGTALFWDFWSASPSVNAASDVCMVLINAWASEGFDRPDVRDDYSDDLITNVASQCRNTVVVIHNAGVRVVDPWIDHPNVTALLFAHLPGQASGHALVDLLYGRASPSGKLPYTVARNSSDYSAALLEPALPGGIYARFPQANFSEGVMVDYRRFDALNLTPRYEFGFGLSYTTFSFADLQIRMAGNGSANATSTATVAATNTTVSWARYPTGTVQPGGPADLWDELVTVTVQLTNTGRVAGAEVAQLYVTLPEPAVAAATDGNSSDTAAHPPTAPRQLRGFDKPLLNPSQKTTVSFALTRRDLSIWDTVAQKWLLQPGSYGVAVGSSSRQLPLQGVFTVL